jgi:hypothetical protein
MWPVKDLTTGFIDWGFGAVRNDDFESYFPRSDSRSQTGRSSANHEYIELTRHCTLPSGGGSSLRVKLPGAPPLWIDLDHLRLERRRH